MLRSVDRSVLGQTKLSTAALELTDADAALVALALALAETIDDMGPDERARMLPQHSSQLTAVLRELRGRAGGQLKPGVAPVSRLQALREARRHLSV